MVHLASERQACRQNFEFKRQKTYLNLIVHPQADLTMKRRTFLAESLTVATGLTCAFSALAKPLTEVLSAPPLICAHRGWLNPTETENSLAQMRHTYQRGPFMMEIDLAQNRDGLIVLMHDQNVDRTTTDHGPLTELDTSTLQSLHLKNATGATQEHIPVYSDVLDWAAKTSDALLMLDIKDVRAADALRPVRLRNLSGRVVVLTFHQQQAREALEADPKVLVSVLITRPHDLEMYRQIFGTRQFAAYVPQKSDAGLFHAAHQAGAIVITDLLGPTAIADRVSPIEGGRRTLSLPIDILVTNTPLKLRTALRTLEARFPRQG